MTKLLGITTELFSAASFITWENLTVIAKAIATSMPDIIVQPETAIVMQDDDVDSWYFNFRFSLDNGKGIKRFFDKYDPNHTYDADMEVNENGWCTVPESMSVALLKEMNLVDFIVDRIIVCNDGILLVPKSSGYAF